MGQECLGAEHFYPDCSECGVDGGLLVTTANVKGVEWHCLKCGCLFDSPVGSPWAVAGRFDGQVRQSYIDCEIRGLSVVESAQYRNVSKEQISGHLSAAKSPETHFPLESD